MEAAGFIGPIMHEEVRELITGVGMAVGLIIVMTIVVLITSFIVSALF